MTMTLGAAPAARSRRHRFGRRAVYLLAAVSALPLATVASAQSQSGLEMDAPSRVTDLTGRVAAAQAAYPMVQPASGLVTSNIGVRCLSGTEDDDHYGYDIGNPIGTPVHAAYAGTVRNDTQYENGKIAGYGHFIVMTHESGYTTRYAHLSRFALASGTRVEKGAVIGYTGNTGSSDGPHLHFEIRRNGDVQNINDVIRCKTRVKALAPIAYSFPGLKSTAPPAPPYNPKWVGMATTTSGKGYWRVTRDGAVHSFGDAKYAGGANDRPLQAPIVGMAADPDGTGYWLVAKDGGIFSFQAPFYGSKGGQTLSAPIVGMAARVDANGQNKGYWLVAEDGGVFSYGKAPFKGSMGGRPLSYPVKGMAAHPSGNGYWLVSLDGGVFTFGDARFHGSRNGKPNSGFVVGIAPSKSGKGYWLASTGGGVYSFGDAVFAGSTADKVLVEPVLGINADPDGTGYRLHAGDGAVFTYQASFHGTPPK